MPSAYSSELLIRISADPSNAEANIERFRRSFSRDLAGLGTDLKKWSAQGLDDLGRLTSVDKTLQNLASHWRISLTGVNDALQRNRQFAQLWKTDLVARFAEVREASQALESSLVRSFLIFDSALGANLANAVIWQKSIGEAFRKAALQAIGSIAQEALVRAVYSTALGFYLLAVQDYRGAALAFKSAATFGLVGGAASLAGRALAGADVREGEQGSIVRRPGAVAPDLIVSRTGQNLAQPAPAQRSVQVIFQGPVYGGQAGIDELVRHISQAVTERDVNLTAYTVVRQPATRA